MENLITPPLLSIRRVTLVALLVFFVVLTSSPSILRGFTPAAISKAAPILLILALALKANFRLPAKFLFAWGLCFSVMLFSGVVINLSASNAAPAINSAVILLLLLVMAAHLQDQELTATILKWWRTLFWIIAVCSIANWVLAQTVPSIFREIDFGEFYEGNARQYLISPFGAVVLQDYGVFALYRVTGILAEPGMMSMFFLANATMGLFSKSPLFSRRFALANLLAAFATHSVAFYLALSAVFLLFLVKGKNRRLQALVACVFFVMAIANYSVIETGVQGLLERSSLDVRESDSDFMTQQISENPLFSMVGYAWFGEYRQLPAAFPQLFYQGGLLTMLSYALILWFFVMYSLPVAIVIFIYGLSIDYQTFMIFPLLLFVIRAHSVMQRTLQVEQAR